MIKTLKRLTLVLAFAALGVVAPNAEAEPSNPSLRSLNKMSRRGNPTVSIMSLATVCPTVKTVTGNEFLWKSEISKHIGSGDSRASGPSFICGRICASKFPMDFFYSDGSKAGRVGQYGTYHGNGQPRAYCSVGGAP